MLALIGLVEGLGVPSQFVKPLLAVVGALLLLGALAGAKCAYDRHIINQHDAKVAAQADAANNQAAAERSSDDARNAQSDKERHDAVHSVPDTPPGGPSHALACKRLRDLGRDPPACR